MRVRFHSAHFGMTQPKSPNTNCELDSRRRKRFFVGVVQANSFFYLLKPSHSLGRNRNAFGFICVCYWFYDAVGPPRSGGNLKRKKEKIKKMIYRVRFLYLYHAVWRILHYGILENLYVVDGDHQSLIRPWWIMIFIWNRDAFKFSSIKYIREKWIYFHVPLLAIVPSGGPLSVPKTWKPNRDNKNRCRLCAQTSFLQWKWSKLHFFSLERLILSLCFMFFTNECRKNRLFRHSEQTQHMRHYGERARDGDDERTIWMRKKKNIHVVK